MKGAALITPAVSHVRVEPGSGILGNMQRRQGVLPGITFIIIPWVEMAAPYTHGMPCLRAVSFIR